MQRISGNSAARILHNTRLPADHRKVLDGGDFNRENMAFDARPSRIRRPYGSSRPIGVRHLSYSR